MSRIIKNTLTADELRQAVGMPPIDVHAEIESIVNETLSLLEDMYDKTVERPIIVYDLKGTTAGQAQSRTENGIKTYKIRVNNDLLFGSHREHMLRQTIPHEVAHIFVYQVWPGVSGHGNEWRSVMRSLGLPATRCHQYEVTKARKREKMTRQFIFTCACREHKLTKIRYRRIMQENKSYRCKLCGTILEFDRIGE